MHKEWYVGNIYVPINVEQYKKVISNECSIKCDNSNDKKRLHPEGFIQDMIMFRGDGETFVSKHILKNNYKTIYNPKASVLHIVPKERMTIESFKRRSFNQGISNSYSDIRKNILIKK